MSKCSICGFSTGCDCSEMVNPLADFIGSYLQGWGETSGGMEYSLAVRVLEFLQVQRKARSEKGRYQGFLESTTVGGK